MKKTNKIFTMLLIMIFVLLTTGVVVFAADGNSPVESMKKLTELIYLLVRMIGLIFCIWGFAQFATAWQSHDGAGRLAGLTTLVIGLLIFFAKEILSWIGVSV